MFFYFQVRLRWPPTGNAPRMWCWSRWSIAEPAMLACTCYLSNYIFDMAIKSLADLQAGQGGSDGVDDTGLWLWPAAVGKGDPPGGHPSIYTFKGLCNCKCSDYGSTGNVFHSRTYLLGDDLITQTPLGDLTAQPHISLRWEFCTVAVAISIRHKT